MWAVATSPPPPPAPLFPFPPTLDDPQATVRAWFFDPVATMVTQATGDKLSLGVANFLAGPFEAEYRKRYVSMGRKLRVAHDWRSCARYDPKARDQLLSWGRSALPYCDDILICMSDRSPFVRIAISTGVTMMQALGMRIHLTSDLTAYCADLARHHRYPP